MGAQAVDALGVVVLMATVLAVLVLTETIAFAPQGVEARAACELDVLESLPDGTGYGELIERLGSECADLSGTFVALGSAALMPVLYGAAMATPLFGRRTLGMRAFGLHVVHEP